MVLLGSIVVPAGGSANNTNTTGTPFTIPPSYEYVLLVTPAEAAGFNVTVATGSSLAATTNDFNVGGQTSTQIACPQPSGNLTVVAIYNGGGGGTVKVFGTDGLAQA